MRIHTRQDDRFHALIPQPDPEIGSYDEQSCGHILPPSRRARREDRHIETDLLRRLRTVATTISLPIEGQQLLGLCQRVESERGLHQLTVESLLPPPPWIACDISVEQRAEFIPSGVVDDQERPPSANNPVKLSQAIRHVARGGKEVRPSCVCCIETPGLEREFLSEPSNPRQASVPSDHARDRLNWDDPSVAVDEPFGRVPITGADIQDEARRQYRIEPPKDSAVSIHSAAFDLEEMRLIGSIEWYQFGFHSSHGSASRGQYHGVLCSSVSARNRHCVWRSRHP